MRFFDFRAIYNFRSTCFHWVSNWICRLRALMNFLCLLVTRWVILRNNFRKYTFLMLHWVFYLLVFNRKLHTGYIKRYLYSLITSQNIYITEKGDIICYWCAIPLSIFWAVAYFTLSSAKSFAIDSMRCLSFGADYMLDVWESPNKLLRSSGVSLSSSMVCRCRSGNQFPFCRSKLNASGRFTRFNC